MVKSSSEIFDGAKIIITMDSDGSDIRSTKTKVFVRDGKGESFTQVGLIGKIKLKGNSKDPFMDFTMKFPRNDFPVHPAIRKSLAHNTKLLHQYGVRIKRYKDKKYKRD